MGSKSYRLQVRVFALGLISLVVLGFNFRGFQTWMNSESNKLSTDSTSALVESNEPPSKRLASPATNSARVVPPSDGLGISSRAAANDTKTDTAHGFEAQHSKVESNGQPASKLIESGGDGLYVISLQGTSGADKRDEGRLDAFNQAWERSCGSPPKINHCPGVMDARRGYGLTRSWLQCLEMARTMDLDVTIIFEDDARLFERDSSLSFCNATARKTEFWSRLPDDTFLVFLGGHTWTYADGEGESGGGSSGLGEYREASSSYGTYGFALPRKSFDEILGTIRNDIDHGFVDEEGVTHKDFLSPERSWYSKAKVLGKKIYAASPLTVWHEGGYSNTWKNNRWSITGEETSADQGIRGIPNQNDADDDEYEYEEEEVHDDGGDDGNVGAVPVVGGLSACLLVKDDNWRLGEWLAYHWTVIGMTHLVVAVDPSSKTSPKDLLDTWRAETDIDIVLWNDADFRFEEPKNWETIFVHQLRQKFFLVECLRHHKAKGRSWTLHTDTDEFLANNVVFGEGQQRSMISKGRTLYDYLASDAPVGVDDIRDEVCVTLPRHTFSAIESDEGREHSSLTTLRFFFHSDPEDFEQNKYAKVLINLRKVPFGLINRGDLRSIHCPFKQLCDDPSKINSQSPLTVNHYVGSWEQYISRIDGRRGRDKFMKKASLNHGESHQLRDLDWLSQFVDKVGDESSALLLEGAGSPAKLSADDPALSELPDYPNSRGDRESYRINEYVNETVFFFADNGDRTLIKKRTDESHFSLMPTFKHSEFDGTFRGYDDDDEYEYEEEEEEVDKVEEEEVLA